MKNNKKILERMGSSPKRGLHFWKGRVKPYGGGGGKIHIQKRQFAGEKGHCYKSPNIPKQVLCWQKGSPVALDPLLLVQAHPFMGLFDSYLKQLLADV